ncbi:MAG: type II toxin-antitoxin system RelE/ParE family toxin [Planctomycetes bacterium]|nr:type II toxin-antitoxin system RelE/ParE family toxin [Planctomycetota bacterium]MCW8135389.1 type II toxin-antitoxin system RelE/ParE family toxin [Planctomycetota bacterium]
MKAVVIEPAAERQIRQAFAWYERQSTGLGQRFVDELDRLIQSISQFPRSFPEVTAGVRRAVEQRFGFNVAYVQDDELVYVIAVVHGSRHPDAWMKPDDD